VTDTRKKLLKRSMKERKLTPAGPQGNPLGEISMLPGPETGGVHRENKMTQLNEKTKETSLRGGGGVEVKSLKEAGFMSAGMKYGTLKTVREAPSHYMIGGKKTNGEIGLLKTPGPLVRASLTSTLLSCTATGKIRPQSHTSVNRRKFEGPS